MEREWRGNYLSGAESGLTSHESGSGEESSDEELELHLDEDLLCEVDSEAGGIALCRDEANVPVRKKETGRRRRKDVRGT